MTNKLLVLSFLAVVGVSASASELQDQLSREFKNKIVILRGFPVENRVQFDENGNMTSPVHHGFWTSDGMVQIQNVSVKHHDEVRFRGRRLVNIFNKDNGTFTNFATKQEFEADIRIDPTSRDAAAVTPLLDKVFFRDVHEMSLDVPDYWRACMNGIHRRGKDWACGKEKKTTATTSPLPGTVSTANANDQEAATKPAANVPTDTDSKATAQAAVSTEPVDDAAQQNTESSNVGAMAGEQPGAPVYRVGKHVTAPRATYHPDPVYSERARQARLHGTTLLWVVIGAQGDVQRVIISRPLGGGLDDKAVEAVKKWKFAPSTLDGKPVAVQVNIEVNYRLY